MLWGCLSDCESPILSSQKTHYLHVKAISFHFPLLHSEVCNSVFYNLSSAPRSQVAEGLSQLTLVCFQLSSPRDHTILKDSAAVKGTLTPMP